MVKINGNVSREEANAYIEYLENKHNRKLKEISIEIDGDYADLSYQFEPVSFERIRRVTGYLSGTVDRFNNAKQAEVRDRLKHSMEG